jgi:protein SCO1
MPTDSPRKPTLREILRARPWLMAPWIALFLAAPVMFFLQRKPAQIPVYRTLPSWTLTDQTSGAYGSQALHGHAFIANFMFTSCPFSCPRLTRHMVRVQSLLRDHGAAASAVRMVSFTVDPVIDTPGRLAEYTQRYGVDSARWRFVTGPTESIQRLSVEGFQIAMGAPPEGRPQGYNILHGEHIMLVDPTGRIRGYYRSDDDGLAKVVHDAEAVSAER